MDVVNIYVIAAVLPGVPNSDRVKHRVVPRPQMFLAQRTGISVKSGQDQLVKLEVLPCKREYLA